MSGFNMVLEFTAANTAAALAAGLRASLAKDILGIDAAELITEN